MARPAETLERLALASTPLDRDAEARSDPDLIPRLQADSATRVIAVAEGRTPVVETDGHAVVTLRSPQPADASRLAAYLGSAKGGPPYLLIVEEAAADDWRTLRQVGAALDDQDAAVFATALALANWHGAHQFCPRCGQPTEPAQAGWIRKCTADGSEHYPRTDSAVIMSVIDADGRLLLARGPQWTEKRYSVLAGFLEPGETLEAAVAREVREEVGIGVEDVTYLGGQPWPFPTSIMLGFTARATSTDLVLQDGEIAEALWTTRENLRDKLASGEWGISGRLSIARRLIEHWYGEEITGQP